MRHVLALFLCLIAVTACSKVDLLNATITREGYRVERGIAYGSHARQQMDIYVPEHATSAPVIVFFYGGSWQRGDRQDYRFLGQAFAEQGFVTAVVDYRLYPEVKFPHFIEDGAQAVRYVHDHIRTHGGDPDRLFVAGHSAGAYIAMMLGAEPRYLKQAGGDRRMIHGVIGIAGPYDFLPFTDPAIADIFSTAEAASTQPINHITHAMPPVFLATGDADDTVDPRNSHRVAAKLRALHRPVVDRTYPEVDHITIMLSLAQRFRERTTLLNDVTQFVRAVDGAPASR